MALSDRRVHILSTMTRLKSILKCSGSSHVRDCSMNGSMMLSSISHDRSNSSALAISQSDHCRRRPCSEEDESCPGFDLSCSRRERRRRMAVPTGKPAKRSVSFPGLDCRWVSSSCHARTSSNPSKVELSPSDDGKSKSPLRKPERRTSFSYSL